MRALLSRPIVAAVVVIGLLAPEAIRAAWRGKVGADAWWLAAAGREMIAAGDVLRVNRFAYTDPTEPWVCHEWLLGVVFATGLQALGSSFFVLLGIVCGAATSMLAIWAICRTVRSNAAALIAVLITLGPLATDLHGVRPLILSMALPVGMVLLAFSRSPGALSGAVLLEWLWASIHGSFAIGIGIMAVAALDDDVPHRYRRARLAATAAALAITFVNPYGPLLHGLVRRYVTGGDQVSRYIHENVAEFFPITRGEPPWVDTAAIVGAIAVTALAVSSLRRRRRLARSAFVLSLVGLSLYEVRHFSLAILLGGVLLCGEIDEWLPADERVGAGRLLWPAGLVHLVAALVAAIAFRARPMSSLINEESGGPALHTLIDALPDGARVYAGFLPASHVIFWGAPRGIRVFFDPRNDCYSARTWQAAIDVVAFGDARATDILLSHGTTHALVPRDGLPYATDPRWVLERTEGELGLYRASP